MPCSMKAIIPGNFANLPFFYYYCLMAYRLSKIVTRTGDDGSTSLGDGSRVSKHDLRIEVMGDIDELNSMLGLALCESFPAKLGPQLTRIQNDLFDLGGELCIPTHRVLTDGHVLQLDQWVADLNATLPPLKEFILPGGSRAAALVHVARTLCRRAERHLVALKAQADISEWSLQYLNRLSDYLFVLARTLNQYAGVRDVCWERGSLSPSSQT